MDALTRSRELMLELAAAYARKPAQACSDGAASPLRQLSLHALAWKHTRLPAQQQAARRDVLSLAPFAADTGTCGALAEHLLAWSHGSTLGLEPARQAMSDAATQLTRRFWRECHGLFADDADGKLAPCRIQSGNLRACEALLAAFESGGEPQYLRRAETIAYNITVRQAGLTGGVVWEHYHPDWSPDWDHGHDVPPSPSGFDPAIQIAWALLLLRLEQHPVAMASCAAWIPPRAEELFLVGMDRGWDEPLGGLCGGLSGMDDGGLQLEMHVNALTAAALLATRCEGDRYRKWHDRIWRYTWPYLARRDTGRDEPKIAYQLLRALDSMALAPLRRCA